MYVLLTSLLFPGRPLYAGGAFAGCYLLGALAAFGTATLFGRTWLRGQPRPMVLELPTYKWPSLRNALLHGQGSGRRVPPDGRHRHHRHLHRHVVAERVSAGATARRRRPRCRRGPPSPVSGRTEACAARRSATPFSRRRDQAGSFAGRIGRASQPVFRAAGLRLAADRRHPDELPGARSLRVDDVGAGRRTGRGDVDEGVIAAHPRQTRGRRHAGVHARDVG